MSISSPIKTENSSLQVVEILRRLFITRNIILSASIISVFLFVVMSDVKLPVLSLFMILNSMIVLNFLLWLCLLKRFWVSEIHIVIQLSLDVLAFTGVLYLTGGATNPVGWFYLVYIFFAASTLPVIYTWFITLLSIAGYTLVMFFYEPLADVDPHAMHHNMNDSFQLHVIGMLMGFVATSIFVTFILGRMANSMRKQNKELALIREQALKDENLIALGTLAAGAAHELGTPLSTLAVLSKEVELDVQENDYETLAMKASLITDQVNRCKEALAVISHSAGESQASSGGIIRVSDYLQEIIENWRKKNAEIELHVSGDITGFKSTIMADYTITQALHTILNNSADASPHYIELHANCDTNWLSIEIKDEGEGLDEHAESVAGKRRYSSKENGMGLGLYLAYSSIQRFGGEIELFNRKNNSGTCTRIQLPLYV